MHNKGAPRGSPILANTQGRETVASRKFAKILEGDFIGKKLHTSGLHVKYKNQKYYYHTILDTYD